MDLGCLWLDGLSFRSDYSGTGYRKYPSRPPSSTDTLSSTPSADSTDTSIYGCKYPTELGSPAPDSNIRRAPQLSIDSTMT